VNSKGRLLFSSFIASILILGSLGFVQQSYAQAQTTSAADLNPPIYVLDDCAVGFSYFPPGSVTGNLLRVGDCEGFNLTGDPTVDCPTINDLQTQTNSINECHFFVPNFDDPFDTKLIRIQATYDLGLIPPQVRVQPSSGNCVLDQRFDEPRYFFEDWICHPNPFNEQVWISFEPGTELSEVIIDSVSFGEPRVGGIFEGVDTTSLLVAGAQMNAAWMIPVIVSAIGIGIVIARKF